MFNVKSLMLPVGTRHAVSYNNSKSGLGMPSPYNPEREQIQDREAGLKQKTNIPPPERCSSSPYLRGTKRVERYSPLSPPETGGVPKGRGDDETEW